MNDCPTCRQPARSLVTYKHIWRYCDACGCMAGEQRDRYPLEWLAELLSPLARSERAKEVLAKIGRKPQGVEFYRYYEQRLISGDRGKWAGQYAQLQGFLATLGLTLRGRTLLDISGEPGFFVKDAAEDGAIDPIVTAYADNVTRAMRHHLGVRAFTFDFNSDHISGRYDAILSRWAIGFCENIAQLFAEVRDALTPGGLFVVQHSPASRAICSRWMFDDYTYLRAFTQKTLIEKAGMKLVGVRDEGSFHYAADLHILTRTFIGAYRLLTPGLRTGGNYHLQQHNETLVFTKA